jgi:hypothetical protein
MNENNWGLVIFAVIALAAVFSFILVVGPPTGQYASGIGTSTYQIRDAFEACARGSNCNNRVNAVPIGYDEATRTVICECPVQVGAYTPRYGFTFRRSIYQ